MARACSDFFLNILYIKIEGNFSSKNTKYDEVSHRLYLVLKL